MIPKNKTEARAGRVWPPKPESTVEAIDVIVELMINHQYIRGDSKSLAAAWDMHPRVLRHWTAEASRRIKSQLSDDDVKSMLEQRMFEVMMADDRHDVVQAARFLADIRGLVTKKVHQTNTVEKMSVEEIDKELKRDGIELKLVEGDKK